jgi:dipeptidyl aminopeptidase/acylaminoacyl peptidase
MTAVGVLVALLAGGYLVDRQARGYLSGQRRVPGRESLGAPSDGPVPGYAFLGFTTRSENPAGLRIVRPFESGREIGLERGDVVTGVDGKVYDDGETLFRDMITRHKAGDTLSLSVSAPTGRTRELALVLKPFLRNPADLGLPYEDVEIGSDSGFKLRGWFVPPPVGSDGRAGVFVHGAMSSRFQALEQGGEHWHRRGYGLLAMDLSGRGSSEGKYVTYTLNERKDVASMIRWLRSREGVDPAKVVVFGTSNGAASAIYAAASDPALPALALDAPYSDLWVEAGEMLASRRRSPLWLRPLRWAVWFRAGVDLRAVRPVEAITRISAPVLLIHGGADREVMPYHSERLEKARREAGLPTERWLITGGEHGFDNYPAPGVFWDRVVDFFDRALDGPPPAAAGT